MTRAPVDGGVRRGSGSRRLTCCGVPRRGSRRRRGTRRCSCRLRLVVVVAAMSAVVPPSSATVYRPPVPSAAHRLFDGAGDRPVRHVERSDVDDRLVDGDRGEVDGSPGRQRDVDDPVAGRQVAEFEGPIRFGSVPVARRSRSRWRAPARRRMRLRRRSPCP